MTTGLGASFAYFHQQTNNSEDQFMGTSNNTSCYQQLLNASHFTITSLPQACYDSVFNNQTATFMMKACSSLLDNFCSNLSQAYKFETSTIFSGMVTFGFLLTTCCEYYRRSDKENKTGEHHKSHRSRDGSYQ